MTIEKFKLVNGLDNNGQHIVNVADPVNAQDVATKNFVATSLSTIVPGSTTLAALTDVSETTPADGQVLTYNTSSGKWVNSTSASGGAITVTGDVTGSGTSSIELTLNTVNASTGTYGSTWIIPEITVNAKGLITSVSQATLALSDSLQDVTLTPLTTGQVLTYNGTNWSNATPASGGSGGADPRIAGTFSTNPSIAASTNTGSLAIGDSATIVGNTLTSAIAIGYTARIASTVSGANYDGPIAIGEGANLVDSYFSGSHYYGPFANSIAIGTNATISVAANAVVIGANSSTIANYSVIVGANSTIGLYNAYSVALGNTNVLGSSFSTVAGALNTLGTRSNYCVMLGYQNTVTGNVGTASVDYCSNNTVIGYYNSVAANCFNNIIIGNGCASAATPAVPNPGTTPASMTVASSDCISIGANEGSVPSIDTGSNYGITLGYNAVIYSSTPNSIAIGYGANVASGQTSSIAIGYNATNSATDSIVFGTAQVQNGSTYGIAIGQAANVSSNHVGAIAIGYSTNASGTNSLSVGYHNVSISNSHYSTMLGNSSYASSPYTTVIGSGCNATGQYSITIGSGCTTNGYSASVAIGKNASTSVNGELTFATGTFASGTSASNKVSWIPIWASTAPSTPTVVLAPGDGTASDHASGYASYTLALVSGSMYIFDVDVVAVNSTFYGGECAAFNLKFCVSVQGSTATIQGTPALTTLYNNSPGSAWSVSATVSGLNLSINAVGDATTQARFTGNAKVTCVGIA